MSGLGPYVSNACDLTTFSTPSLFGAEIVHVDVQPVTNYSFPAIEGWRYTQPSVPVVNAEFCNVTVTYTHTGQNDSINIEAWLPSKNYNGILQAIGGGGWVAGRFVLAYAGMAGAVADGYATVSTDAGLGNNAPYTDWILESPGNINVDALDNFGYVSLHDEAVVVKQLIHDFYGQPPAYSYWNACSNGGRQGAMLAQRYPQDFDGIIAAAPAIDWAEILITSLWGTVYMNMSGNYPRGCELDEITTIGVSFCDKLDGVADGLISDPEKCKAAFNPRSYVGHSFNCSDMGEKMNLSQAAVELASALYNGARTSNGDFIWYGFEVGADLKTLAPTNCTQEACVATGVEGVAEVYKYFVDKNPAANRTKLSYSDFDTLVLSLKHLFSGTVEANSTDLDGFRQAGGKMITYHGLTDPSIPPRGSLQYYEAISRRDPLISDFYRLFPVPGLQHCFGGNGGQPVHMFDQLRTWVENGTAPDSSPVTITRPDNTTQEQILCAWPQKAVYDVACVDTKLSCWSCVA